MGSEALRGRTIWQDISGAKATVAEYDFYSVFSVVFMGTTYRIRSKPQEFNSIYVNVELSPEVLAEIYTPSA